MGGKCSAYGGEETCTQFWWGTMREREHLGIPGVNGNLILKLIFRKWDEVLRTGGEHM
jgi:hypothetical protein